MTNICCLDAVRKNPLTAKASVAETEKEMKTRLRGAPDRNGGLAKRAKNHASRRRDCNSRRSRSRSRSPICGVGDRSSGGDSLKPSRKRRSRDRVSSPGDGSSVVSVLESCCSTGSGSSCSEYGSSDGGSSSSGNPSGP